MASNIWRTPVDASGEPSGPEVAVTRETGRNSRPAVSNDGKRIALSRWRPGANQDVWIVDVDGKNAVQRTTDGADDDYPHWFAGDRRLGFMSLRRGHRAFFVLDLVTGREDVVADFGPGNDAMRVSPDGTKVAFHSDRGGTTLNVWVADLPAGTPRQVTFDREFAGFPCWSPDGGTLAFEAKRRRGRPRLHRPRRRRHARAADAGEGTELALFLLARRVEDRLRRTARRRLERRMGLPRREDGAGRDDERSASTATSATPPGPRRATRSTTSSPRRPGTSGSSRCPRRDSSGRAGGMP